jgi:hypothetical protein
MPFTIRRVEYFYAWVEDQPGEAYKLLSILADVGVSLLAFTAIPVGPVRTQLTIFPDDSLKMASAAQKAKVTLDGPHRALLVQGDDKLGALAEVHAKLFQAGVNVSASSGVTDGRGCYGYIIYIRPEQFDKAAAALEV